MKSNKKPVLGHEYDPECCLVKTKFKTPGYHSMVKTGTIVHPIRDSIRYAFELLHKDDSELTERAYDVIQKVISLQDTDLYSPTYGIWSWLYEESIEKMSPPDFNWADFIGASLCEIIIAFPDKLDDNLKTEIKASIKHASYSIFRRNVRSDYTNIALMGATVTAIAGELLEDDFLLEYAQQRIKAFSEHLNIIGLNEYNSPTYTTVAIREMDRIINLCNDKEIKEHAEKIRFELWKMIASHYHPGTAQLVGPYSRAYSDLLRPAQADFINTATSEEYAEQYTKGIQTRHRNLLPCPETLRKRFTELPEAELSENHCYISVPTKYSGTIWMNEDACLGSINHDCLWVQRRPVIGFWKVESHQPAIFKISALKDDKEFASMAIYNAQKKNEILSGIKTYNDCGDYHIHLDKKNDQCFEMKNLCIRIEVISPVARLNRANESQVEMIAGDYKVVINYMLGSFDGNEIVWRTSTSEGKVYLDAILYEGENKSICFDKNMNINMVFTTELMNIKEHSNGELPTIKNITKHETVVKWKNLKFKYNQFGTNSRNEIK
jgi:hypothetical protein